MPPSRRASSQQFEILGIWIGLSDSFIFLGLSAQRFGRTYISSYQSINSKIHKFSIPDLYDLLNNASIIKEYMRSHMHLDE